MNRKGFTLLELLVVMAIIAIIAAIIFPVFSMARESGRRANCMSNIRSVSQAILQYAGDNGSRLPQWTFCDGEYTWDWAIFGYVKKDTVFSCPTNSAKVRRASTFPIGPQTVIRAHALPRNISGMMLSDIPRASMTVLLFEKGSQPLFSWGDSTGENFRQMWDVVYDPDLYPHDGQKSFAFVDGHAKFFKLKTGPFEYWFDRDKYPKGYCGNLSGPTDLSNNSEPGANLPR